MKKSKFAIAATLLALALSQNALAEEPASSAKYDMDYMDEGVHVIIPKLLPETHVKAGNKLAFNVKYYPGKDQSPTIFARAFDESISEAYKAEGYDAGHAMYFGSAVKYNQFLAFSGSFDELDALNKKFSTLNAVDSVRTSIGNVVGAVAGFVGGAIIGGTQGAVQASVGSLGRDYKGNVHIKNAKSAVFDGYQDLPVKPDEAIEIYGVSTQDEKFKGNIVFITDKAQVNEAVVIRGIMKAQNIVKDVN